MLKRNLQCLSHTSASCRGQRIVYELALQELFIAYSGYGGEHPIEVLHNLHVDAGFSLFLAWCMLRGGCTATQCSAFSYTGLL